MNNAPPDNEITAIDVHAHVTVGDLLSKPGLTDSWRPTVHLDDTGHQVSVELDGRTVHSIIGELSRLELILDHSSAHNVQRLVVSPWVSTLPLAMDTGAAAEICRLQNEALAAAIREHQGRLAGFGSVPMQDGALAAQVLTEAVHLGLVGAEVSPSTSAGWLGDFRLEPFFEAAESLGTPIFVHPGTHGLGIDIYNQYYLWNSIGNPVETATAAAHLIMSGTLERHPGLQIILAHGGGALPSLIGRLQRAFAVRTEAAAQLHADPRKSFNCLYFDTVTHDPAVLASLIAAVGSSHVLLGSDHPFDMGSDDPVGDVTRLDLSYPDKSRILWQNALPLFQSTAPRQLGSSSPS